MSDSKPTILFFAGAFADPSCFDEISSKFNQSGYPTAYARIPSLNPTDPASVSNPKDIKHARDNILTPLLDIGKEVIVLVHSYGGMVGGPAAAGLSKTSRKSAGKKGGVNGLLYLAGNIACEGESLLDIIGGAYPSFIKENHPSKGLAVIDPVMDTLYNDARLELEPKMQEGMIPHALAAFETPSTKPAWAEAEFDGRRAYIRTIYDHTIPVSVQDMWVEKTGVDWEVKDMKSGHCPFITRPDETASVCLELFAKWNNLD
ncbi:prolyl aminopeptidase-like protein [Corynespora cassiicola Philippines]|uniref:Prolyl aminopeptidase-like protein n=1 Tax=Corynespora cassiicola Philippines TaxID=1448308 RepID=A0A2T2P1M8_CORCC|nr:prolyl aminopeptidase-like protein [Corynespora cassiicola Philippines]